MDAPVFHLLSHVFVSQFVGMVKCMNLKASALGTNVVWAGYNETTKSDENVARKNT